MNIEGKPGACGFVPIVLRHVLPVYLIKIDEETGEPLRDSNGLCIMCKPGECLLFIYGFEVIEKRNGKRT